jgi:hypothetical protein
MPCRRWCPDGRGAWRPCHQASDASRKAERTTFHVAQRWIDAIRLQAALDGMTYTQIVRPSGGIARASHRDVDGASTSREDIGALRVGRPSARGRLCRPSTISASRTTGAAVAQGKRG